MKCQMQSIKRIKLNKKCSQEELDSINLIQNKLICAEQALQPSVIPENVDDRSVEVFLRGAIKAKGEILFLNQHWWKTMIEKYDLPKDKNVYVDFDTGEFYLADE